MADVLRADQTSAIIGWNSEMGRRILGQWSIRMIADHSFYLVRMTGHRRLCLPAFGPTNTHTRVHVVCIFRWKQALLLAVVNAGPFLGFAFRATPRPGPFRSCRRKTIDKFVHLVGTRLAHIPPLPFVFFSGRNQEEDRPPKGWLICM